MEKALADFLITPGGQRFKENRNGGGGAMGSSGTKGSGTNATRQQYEEMTAKQQSEFIAEGGKIV
jgi:hypothetical protein